MWEWRRRAMNLTKIIFGLNSLDHLYSSHPPMSSHSSLQAFYLQVFLGAPLAPFLARLCLICPQAWAKCRPLSHSPLASSWATHTRTSDDFPRSRSMLFLPHDLVCTWWPRCSSSMTPLATSFLSVRLQFKCYFLRGLFLTSLFEMSPPSHLLVNSLGQPICWHLCTSQFGFIHLFIFYLHALSLL